MINQKIQILDKGYIELLEYMGSDTSIAQSARVSTQSDGKNDRGLIRRLMRDNHTSPFEMGEIKIRIKAPIFVFRQMFRHRTANLNEQSLRYTESECEFYLPTIERMQEQSLDNRQGSGEMLSYENAKKCLDIIRNSHGTSTINYETLLRLGLTRELARNVLEFSLYSSADWKCDLHNILKFLKLRTDSHAQWEFQQYAIAIENIVKELFPITYGAWVDYVKEAVTFSKIEMEILKDNIILNEFLSRKIEYGEKIGEKVFNHFLEKLK
jgi:thymidylate synthase (FAD)